MSTQNNSLFSRLDEKLRKKQQGLKEELATDDVYFDDIEHLTDLATDVPGDITISSTVSGELVASAAESIITDAVVTTGVSSSAAATTVTSAAAASSFTLGTVGWVAVGTTTLAVAASGGSSSSGQNNSDQANDDEASNEASVIPDTAEQTLDGASEEVLQVTKRLISDADIERFNADALNNKTSNEVFVIDLTDTDIVEIVFTNTIAPAQGFKIITDKPLIIDAKNGAGALVIDTDQDVTADIGAGDDKITTGSGNDKIIVAANGLDKGDIIDGGAGNNIIVISGDDRNVIDSTGTDGAILNNITNIELNSSLTFKSVADFKQFTQNPEDTSKTSGIDGDGESLVQVQVSEEEAQNSVDLRDLDFKNLGKLTIEAEPDQEIELVLSKDNIDGIKQLAVQTKADDTNPESKPAPINFAVRGDAETVATLVKKAAVVANDENSIAPALVIEDTPENIEALKNDSDFSAAIEDQNIAAPVLKSLIIHPDQQEDFITVSFSVEDLVPEGTDTTNLEVRIPDDFKQSDVVEARLFNNTLRIANQDNQFGSVGVDFEIVDISNTDTDSNEPTLVIKGIVRFEVIAVNDRPEFQAPINSIRTVDAVESDVADTVLTTSGTTRFIDVDDLDGHTVSIKFNSFEIGFQTITDRPAIGALKAEIVANSEADDSSDGTLIEWNYEILNSDLDFLGDGEKITEVYVLTVTDPQGATNAHDIRVVLTGTNDAPTAELQTNAVDEDAIILGNLVATDVDTNDTLTYAVANPPEGFELTDSSTGAYSFDASNETYQSLAEGDTQNVDVIFTVTDGTDTVTQTLTITVTGTNDAPTATPQTNSVDEDATIVGNLVAEDIDANDSLTYAVANSPEGFELTDSATGEYSFDASNAAYQSLAAGETEEVVVNFTVSDNKGGSVEQTLTITVTGTNDAPTAVPQTNAVVEDATITGNLVAADVDANDKLTYAVAEAPAGFELTDSATGAYSFDASNEAYQSLAAGEKEEVIVNFTVSDGKAEPVEQILTITITGANDTADIAIVADNTNVIEDSGVLVTGTVNVVDVDSGEAEIVSSVANFGSVTVNENNEWTYELDNTNSTVNQLRAGEVLKDVITFTSVDGTQKTQTITITGANDQAVITSVANDAEVTESGRDTDGDLVANGTVSVTDPDTDEAVITAAEATYGFVSLNDSGEWTYLLNDSDPTVNALAQGETLQDVITFTSADGTQDSSVSVTITGSDDASQLTATVDAENGTVDEDGIDAAATGTLSIQDPDNDAQAETGAVNPANITATATYGTVSIDANGAWTYTLNEASKTDPDINGLGDGETKIDTVTFTNNDGETTTADVVIQGVNDAPTAEPQINAVNEDALITGNLVAEDVDANDSLTYAVETLPAGFVLTNAETGAYSFDASNEAYQSLAAGEKEEVIVNFTVSDGKAEPVEQILTITITGANDTADIAIVADNTNVIEDSGVLVTGTVNVVDVDSGEAEIVSSVANFGSVTVNENNEWTYELDNTNSTVNQLRAGEVLKDVITFTSVDGTQKTQTITITGANDQAVITSVANDAEVTESGRDTDGDLVANGTVSVTDPDTYEAVITAAEATYGFVSLNDSGEWTYLLNDSDPTVNALAQGETLQDVITFTSADGTQDSSVSVTITGSDDASQLTATVDAENGTVDEDGIDAAATGTLSIQDPDNDAQAETGAVNPANITATATYGTVSIDANGAWTYTLNEASKTDPDINGLGDGETKIDTVTFTNNDGETTTADVVIQGVNDAPTAAPQTNAVDEDAIIVGNLVATDVDANDKLTYAVADAPAGFVLTNAETGAYSFDASNEAYQSLAAGEKEEVIVTFTVTDGIETVEQNLTITVTGANEEPNEPSDGNFRSAFIEETTENSITILVQAESGLNVSLVTPLTDNGSISFTEDQANPGTYIGTFAVAAKDFVTATELQVHIEDADGNFIETIGVEDFGTTVIQGTNAVDSENRSDEIFAGVFNTSTDTSIVYGFDGDDDLIGSDFDDVIYGGEGADTLEGKGGLNILNGGADSDNFILSESGFHVIEDFTSQSDLIELDVFTSIASSTDNSFTKQTLDGSGVKLLNASLNIVTDPALTLPAEYDQQTIAEALTTAGYSFETTGDRVIVALRVLNDDGEPESLLAQIASFDDGPGGVSFFVNEFARIEGVDVDGLAIDDFEEYVNDSDDGSVNEEPNDPNGGNENLGISASIEKVDATTSSVIIKVRTDNAFHTLRLLSNGEDVGIIFEASSEDSTLFTGEYSVAPNEDVFQFLEIIIEDNDTEVGRLSVEKELVLGTEVFDEVTSDRASIVFGFGGNDFFDASESNTGDNIFIGNAGADEFTVRENSEFDSIDFVKDFVAIDDTFALRLSDRKVKGIEIEVDETSGQPTAIATHAGFNDEPLDATNNTTGSTVLTATFNRIVGKVLDLNGEEPFDPLFKAFGTETSNEEIYAIIAADDGMGSSPSSTAIFRLEDKNDDRTFSEENGEIDIVAVFEGTDISTLTEKDFIAFIPD